MCIICSFSSELLQGWAEGSGLGKDNQGMKSHIRVKNRTDNSGTTDTPWLFQWICTMINPDFAMRSSWIWGFFFWSTNSNTVDSDINNSYIDMGRQQKKISSGSLRTEFWDFLCVAGVGAAEHQAVTRWTVNTHVFDNILKNLKVVCISSRRAFFFSVCKLMLWFSSHSCMNFWDILSSG